MDYNAFTQAYRDSYNRIKEIIAFIELNWAYLTQIKKDGCFLIYDSFEDYDNHVKNNSDLDEYIDEIISREYIDCLNNIKDFCSVTYDFEKCSESSKLKYVDSKFTQFYEALQNRRPLRRERIRFATIVYYILSELKSLCESLTFVCSQISFFIEFCNQTECAFNYEAFYRQILRLKSLSLVLCSEIFYILTILHEFEPVIDERIDDRLLFFEMYEIGFYAPQIKKSDASGAYNDEDVFAYYYYSNVGKSNINTYYPYTKQQFGRIIEYELFYDKSKGTKGNDSIAKLICMKVFNKSMKESQEIARKLLKQNVAMGSCSKDMFEELRRKVSEIAKGYPIFLIPNANSSANPSESNPAIRLGSSDSNERINNTLNWGMRSKN